MPCWCGWNEGAWQRQAQWGPGPGTPSDSDDRLDRRRGTRGAWPGPAGGPEHASPTRAPAPTAPRSRGSRAPQPPFHALTWGARLPGLPPRIT